jgi:hypothetical protein
LEAPDLGNEDGVMPNEQVPGKPMTRRYSQEEKDAAVRIKELEQENRELKRANEGWRNQPVAASAARADSLRTDGENADVLPLDQEDRHAS